MNFIFNPYKKLNNPNKKILFLTLIIISLIFFTFSVAQNKNFIYPSYGEDIEYSIEVLTEHSTPRTGNIWTVYFKTKGKMDLTIFPDNEATKQDLELVGVYCGREPAEFETLDNGIIYLKDWDCNDVSIIQNSVKKEGIHTLKLLFGNQDEYAYNSPVTYKWTRRIGGYSTDMGTSIAIDSENRIIAGGLIYGDTDFNEDKIFSDLYPERSTGYGRYDAYLQVFNSNGVSQWGKRLGGTLDDGVYALTTDPQDRIILIMRSFGSADLNGDNIINLTYPESSEGYGDYDSIITVFDKDGNHQWARRYGSASADISSSVVIDSENNMLIIGRTIGNADLNFDQIISSDYPENATGYGMEDLILLKVSSDGSCLWSKRLGGISNDSGTGIDIDSKGNIFISGEVTGDADLNGDQVIDTVYPESSTGYGNRDIIISKLNPDGDFLWAKRFGGISADAAYTLDVDIFDNLIIGGIVTGDADLDGDHIISEIYPEKSTYYGGLDIFFSKYNSDGDFLWAKRHGGVQTDSLIGIKTDSSGKIITTGYITGIVDLTGDRQFGIEPFEQNFSSSGLDSYINIFSPLGEFVWATRIRGYSGNAGRAVNVDSSDRIFATGNIYGSVDLDGDGILSSAYPEVAGSSLGASDFYLMALSTDYLPPEVNEISPTNDSVFNSYDLSISFITNELATCKASLEDKDYFMIDDENICEGVGSTQHFCTELLGEEGLKKVFINCIDSSGNYHIADNNYEIEYFFDTISPTIVLEENGVLKKVVKLRLI